MKLFSKVATDQHFFRFYISGEDRGGALDQEDGHVQQKLDSALVQFAIIRSHLTDPWVLCLLQMEPLV